MKKKQCFRNFSGSAKPGNAIAFSVYFIASKEV
jgi:hypothetical protein